ncbi:MAG: hypothetical protein AAGE43_10910 [Pseudomonadota bacterium]
MGRLTTLTTVCLLMLAFAPGASAAEATVLDNAAAAAQSDAGGAENSGSYWRWIDAGGRIQYTDFEPVGVPAQEVPLTPPEEDGDTPALSSAQDEWQPDPFHDQDQQILPIEHIGPCADARQQLAVLHTALPVYRDAAGDFRAAWRGDNYRGERFYLEAESRTTAIGAAQAQVLEHCSDPAAFEAEVDAFRDALRD